MCITSFNVTACPPATVTCAAARVVALPQATSCNNVALSLPSFYNVTSPSGVDPLVTVVPPLPSPLSFAPGALGPPQAVGRGGPRTEPPRRKPCTERVTPFIRRVSGAAPEAAR